MIYNKNGSKELKIITKEDGNISSEALQSYKEITCRQTYPIINLGVELKSNLSRECANEEGKILLEQLKKEPDTSSSQTNNAKHVLSLDIEECSDNEICNSVSPGDRTNKHNNTETETNTHNSRGNINVCSTADSEIKLLRGLTSEAGVENKNERDDYYEKSILDTKCTIDIGSSEVIFSKLNLESIDKFHLKNIPVSDEISLIEEKITANESIRPCGVHSELQWCEENISSNIHPVNSECVSQEENTPINSTSMPVEISSNVQNNPVYENSSSNEVCYTSDNKINLKKESSSKDEGLSCETIFSEGKLYVGNEICTVDKTNLKPEKKPAGTFSSVGNGNSIIGNMFDRYSHSHIDDFFVDKCSFIFPEPRNRSCAVDKAENSALSVDTSVNKSNSSGAIGSLSLAGNIPTYNSTTACDYMYKVKDAEWDLSKILLNRDSYIIPESNVLDSNIPHYTGCNRSKGFRQRLTWKEHFKRKNDPEFQFQRFRDSARYERSRISEQCYLGLQPSSSDEDQRQESFSKSIPAKKEKADDISATKVS